MDFVDQVKALAARIPSQREHIKTEAATRNALVEPFIRALGYDTSDLTEVVPEFGADLDVHGVPKNKKVDYGILKDGKPFILIECKHFTDKLNEGYKQLFHYAVATDCHFGVLTNGLIYRFYADLDKPNKLDETPFLELDMLNPREAALEELKCLTKSALNVGGMLTTASELKYVGGMLQILAQQLDSPTDEFAKFFFQQLCPGRTFSGSAKSSFVTFTQRALKQFVRVQVNSSMDASGMGSGAASAVVTTPIAPPAQETLNDSKSQIVTTEEEMEAFYIVKSILRGAVDSKRITHRDVASYFSVLLDDNNRKPICRLYFNNPKIKRLGLFVAGNEKQEDKFDIEHLDDIYQYSDRLRDAAKHYGA